MRPKFKIKAYKLERTTWEEVSLDTRDIHVYRVYYNESETKFVNTRTYDEADHLSVIMELMYEYGRADAIQDCKLIMEN